MPMPEAILGQSSAFAASDGKSLVLYYSLSGNTRSVAKILHGLVGGDIEGLHTVQPYPDNFDAVVEQAREERRLNFLPPIQPLKFNPDAYHTIYLGFPIWGNTIPQPMATFLASHGLAGKTIIPFCTHDGYGVGRAFQAIKEYCPDAKVLPGFDMLGSDARNAKKLLVSWLEKLGRPIERSDKDGNTLPITVGVGSIELEGMLNGSDASLAFRKLLPLTVSMTEYGGREYYGAIAGRLDTAQEGKLVFEDGDITYCPQNNTIAIFFAQTDRPNLTMRVIPIGKISGDLALFSTLPGKQDVHFSVRAR